MSEPFSEISVPEGGFQVILSDPPWRFRTWTEDDDAKTARRHYDVMTLDDICALPVKSLAAKDCALFMWATWPTIFQAEKVIRAWGFRFSGLAWEWIKRNPTTGKYAFGTGYGTRKNLEPCILALRGAPKLRNRATRDFMYAPRREHSRKPDEQYGRIEAMYEGPYLEMFARTRCENWSSWGNQTDRFAEKTVETPIGVPGAHALPLATLPLFSSYREAA